MSEPVILRIVRPYASEDEFLAGDLWTIDAKGALLVDQRALEPGTLVRFDVLLSSGERVIRAEGKVAKYVEPTATRPGGLRVRFTRFGGSTKAFIDRAVALRRAAPPPARAEAPPTAASTPEAAPGPASAPAPPRSAPAHDAPSPSADRTEAAAVPSAPTAAERVAVTQSSVVASAEPVAHSVRAASGGEFGERRQSLRARAVQHVPAPANRDALLERLRSRARR